MFTIELLRGQALSPVFTNTDIITGLVDKNITVEPIGIQNLDEKECFVIYICNTL